MLFNKNLYFVVLIVFSLLICCNGTKAQTPNLINLAGKWQFCIDSNDVGETQQWFSKKMKRSIRLPGSMTTNNLGNEITVNTPWTGNIYDSSWFYKLEYAKYRQPGNIKVPFWLQPIKYYKGAAWYQKEIDIPSSWNNKHISLFLERCHWKTTLWVDGKNVGSQNSLAAPHIYDLDSFLLTGKHTITIRIDNRIQDVNVGIDSHSITDHTQTNWNGMVGKLLLIAEPQLYIDDAKLYPDIQNKKVVAIINYKNTGGKSLKAQLKLLATSGNPKTEKIQILLQDETINKDSGTITIAYAMGHAPLLWDEFHPNLYNMHISLSANGSIDEKNIQFGIRSFSEEGTQFTINGRRTFLRGTLECAVTPLTGYPSTRTAYWKHIFAVCKSYGLNHIRFHSWCPPEAAFESADSAGFYLQIECSSWASEGEGIGSGKPIDQFIYDESNRIVNAYGNHPSFCMMVYGNEPAGEHLTNFLRGFVEYWKKKDPRHLYSTAAGWPVISESDYNITPDPRIQLWGDGLNSIINSKPPQTAYDWSDIIAKWQHPTVSHEVGQWCVYPDFKEMPKYTGILKAKNFEIFKATLNEHGMSRLADSFLLASGKLQALCYKADIEAALRTKGFGGFQLLGLNDFPGQGTAVVGVVNAFWGDKGYITGKVYSRFCNTVVPLVRLNKMIFLNDETLIAPVEIANFGESILNNVTPSWKITDNKNKILFEGKLHTLTIPTGNGISLGTIEQPLSTVTKPSMLKLTVTVNEYQNDWMIFVYPSSQQKINEDIYVTHQWDDKAQNILNNGGKVLLTFKKGTVDSSKGGSIPVGFSSIFWNTAWTNGQPPNTLGILCNPNHPALQYFPTAYYSDYEWWDAMSHCNAIILDSVSKNLQPIVRVIDDWVTARPLGLVFECKVGKGRLLVSGIDLLTDADKRPGARQLLYSLKKYMTTKDFHPQAKVNFQQVRSLEL
jgi:Glycosyl hydrolases family 2, sugar binding domain/Glycosyl hydrolases family 2